MLKELEISHRLSRSTGQCCGTADKQTGCCSIFEPIIWYAFITFSHLIQIRHEFITKSSRSDVYPPKLILRHTYFSTSHLNMNSNQLVILSHQTNRSGMILLNFSRWSQKTQTFKNYPPEVPPRKPGLYAIIEVF